MTVKELIIQLLDCDMNNEVKLHIEKEHIDEFGEKCSGWLFCIDEIEKDTYQTYINFTDWRDDKKVDDVLDKIRAEIDAHREKLKIMADDDWYAGKIRGYDCAIEIINKYKADTESQKSEG